MTDCRHIITTPVHLVQYYPHTGTPGHRDPSLVTIQVGIRRGRHDILFSKTLNIITNSQVIWIPYTLNYIFQIHSLRNWNRHSRWEEEGMILHSVKWCLFGLKTIWFLRETISSLYNCSPGITWFLPTNACLPTPANYFQHRHMTHCCHMTCCCYITHLAG
jgi:hypothetical protein